MGVTAASWCGPVPGVTRARPPAVAVIGLRRSGRTGNGESPCGLIAPACQPGRSVTPDSGSPQRARDYLRRQAPGALRAPLMLVKKLLTHSARGGGAPRHGDGPSGGLRVLSP